MKILVFEDEIYQYHQLRHILEELDPAYDVIGPITSVEQGRDYLFLHHDIDVIIADTQLSDGLVFDALASAPHTIPVVFTSSSADHALRAFDFYSLSFLMKPVDEHLLAMAMTKARRLIEAAKPLRPLTEMPQLPHRQESYRKRFIVRTFYGERIISIAAIQYFVSEQKTSYIVLLDGTSYPIDISLDTIAKQLDPVRFMKVSRKYIVPLEQVLEMERTVNGKELLRMKDSRAPLIAVSRERKSAVHKWLEGR